MMIVREFIARVRDRDNRCSDCVWWIYALNESKRESKNTVDSHSMSMIALYWVMMTFKEASNVVDSIMFERNKNPVKWMGGKPEI